MGVAELCDGHCLRGDASGRHVGAAAISRRSLRGGDVFEVPLAHVLDERNWRRDISCVMANGANTGRCRGAKALYIWGATAACCAPSAKCCCTGHRMTEARAPQRRNRPPYELFGGDAGVPRAGRCLYDHMDLDEAYQGIRKLHPHTLDSSRDKLYWFLSGWLGGPSSTSNALGIHGCAPAICRSRLAKPSAMPGSPACATRCRPQIDTLSSGAVGMADATKPAVPVRPTGCATRPG